MESGDEVEFEVEYEVRAKVPEANGLGSQINKENEVNENCADAVQVITSVSEDVSNGEMIDSSITTEEASTVDPEKKSSKGSKKSESPAGNQSKKTLKNWGSQPASAVDSQKKRPILSQSASFPKGTLNSSLRKSSSLTKQSKVLSSINNGASVKLSEPASTASSQKKMPVKTAVVATDNSTSDDAESNGSEAKPSGHSLPAKFDDDAHSTTLSITPQARRGTGSGFSFKLDERAEKRKEFFMKLEEKTHAKELEFSNLQAKSKESEDAEIKQLRKSLNFKATPMPSFYKDPGPHKVELKKIPPTRPISPKLGRRKLVVTADNHSEVSNSGASPRLTAVSKKQNEGTVNQGASENLMQKSLAKVRSQKVKNAKPEAKVTSTVKTPKHTTKTEQAKVDTDDLNVIEVSPAINDLEEAASPENTIEEDYTILDHSDSEILAHEIPV